MDRPTCKVRSLSGGAAKVYLKLLAHFELTSSGHVDFMFDQKAL